MREILCILLSLFSLTIIFFVCIHFKNKKTTLYYLILVLKNMLVSNYYFNIFVSCIDVNGFRLIAAEAVAYTAINQKSLFTHEHLFVGETI